jgi:hypothetical protein
MNFDNFCFTALARAVVVQAVAVAAAVTEVATSVSIVGDQLGQHQELPWVLHHNIVNQTWVPVLYSHLVCSLFKAL